MFIKSLQNQNTSQTSTAEHLAAIETHTPRKQRAAGCMLVQAQPRTWG